MTADASDCMRQSMAKYGITQREIVDRIGADIGGDRDRIEAHVAAFVQGGPASMAVAIAITCSIAEMQTATVH
jgi:hypothetical protein